MDNKQYELFFGRLGADPELAYTGKQKAVCKLSVGVNDRETGTTTWKKVVVWGKVAESCNAFLKKGSGVFVQGQSSIKRYPGHDGQERESREVTAWDVGFPDF